MSRTRTDFIVVHCSATKPGQACNAAIIRQWHLARGWRDIGYAEVILPDGTREKGRDMDRDGDTFEEIGAHVAGYNGRSTGICLVGGLDQAGRPANNFTSEQFTALAHAIRECLKRWPQAKVLGHRDFPGVAKECPCFDVRAWIRTIPDLARAA